MTVDQSFIVAIPYPITDSILTSHSVAESEPAWNSGTTYAIDDQVKYGSNHDLFSSKQNSNLNQVPVKYPDETAYWFDEGKTNRWQMFDYLTNYQTTGTSPMTVSLRPGKPITCIYLDGLECDQVTVTITDGVSTVYTKTETTRIRNTYGWYQFFFEEYTYKQSLLFIDLPGAVTDPRITITFTSSSVSTAKCAALILGRYYVLGTTRISSVASRQSFSEFDRNRFGDLRLLRRTSAKKVSASITAARGDVAMIDRLLSQLDAEVAVWAGVANDDSNFYDPFVLRGVYRSPSIQILETKGLGHIELRLDLEGV